MAGSSEFTVATTPVRNRRSREGCWTCRKRRKKCDNASVPCQNCMRLGLKCEREVRLIWEDDARRDGMRKRGPPKPAAGASKTMEVETANASAQQRSQAGSLDAADLKAVESSSASKRKGGTDNSIADGDQRANVASLTNNRVSQWSFSLDARERMLLDHYIQRFSRTYPTFSGPGNPFLRVFLPLSMQSRVVLDSLLALGGVQSWGDGTIMLENSMLALRQKALRGCHDLVKGLCGHEQHGMASNPFRLTALPMTASVSDATNGNQNNAVANKTEMLYLLTSSVLLLLYEKLTGEGQENGASHLRFFAYLFPAKVLHEVMANLSSSNSSSEQSFAEAFQFVSSLFLYNDLVQSTSLRTAMFSNFYLAASGDLDQFQLCQAAGMESQPKEDESLSDRYKFPRLITRTTSGDFGVTDLDFQQWDGDLGWLPSFSLVRPPRPDIYEHLPTADRSLVMDTGYRQLDTFISLQKWTGSRITSELYRIAGTIYRCQCTARTTNHQQQPEQLPVMARADTWTGNLPFWAIQLIELLPQTSNFQNALLWPIGIVAQELTIFHAAERQAIIAALASLEERFRMKHFARTRNYLERYWAMCDHGTLYQDAPRLWFG